jgi:PTH1 family peptidyl-tRNA hydrolase
MKLIIGLGNPENEYGGTRHNIGKDFLNYLREDWQMPAWEFNKNLNADISKNKELGFVFIKPNTYMNECGAVVSKALKYFEAEISDLVIIYDELDLIAGEYKFGFQKHSKIHNGVNSIIDVLETDALWYLRVGVREEGIPFSVQQAGRDPSKYVLAKIPHEDLKKIENSLKEFAAKDFQPFLSKKN